MGRSVKFLNVDVDVDGLDGTQALANYFREHAVVLRDEPDCFSFESLEQHDDADRCIESLVSLIRALPSELALSWQRSMERCFDVGYEADLGAHSVTAELSSASMTAMSEIGVKLRVTVYATR